MEEIRISRCTYPKDPRDGDCIIWWISIMTGGFILRVFAKKGALVANAPNEIMNSIVSGIR